MFHPSLIKYFPPPQFLNPRNIGISFSDSHIKAISFDGGTEKKLIDHTTIALKPGTIVSGTVVNKKELTDVLKGVFEKTKIEYASFAIPDELSYVFSVNVPVQPGKDARTSIEFTIEENVPIPFEDVVFDFAPVSMKKDEAGFNANFVVAAVSKEDLNDYVGCIKNSGFKIRRCVNESQAVANAVIPKDASNIICVVHTKKDRVGMYLAIGGIVHFSTVEQISLGSEDYAKHVLSEYDKLSEYWSRYGGTKKDSISSFIVCGNMELANIAKNALNTKTSLPSALANVWTNVFPINDYIPDVSYEDSVGFATAIGLSVNRNQ